jgi:hypothetical protein
LFTFLILFGIFATSSGLILLLSPSVSAFMRHKREKRTSIAKQS